MLSTTQQQRFGRRGKMQRTPCTARRRKSSSLSPANSNLTPRRPKPFNVSSTSRVFSPTSASPRLLGLIWPLRQQQHNHLMNHGTCSAAGKKRRRRPSTKHTMPKPHQQWTQLPRHCWNPNGAPSQQQCSPCYLPHQTLFLIQHSSGSSSYGGFASPCHTHPHIADATGLWTPEL